MANQVTDNRTLIDTADVADPGGAGIWEDIGATVAVIDDEIFYQGVASIGEFCTTTRAGTFWNRESVGLFSAGDTAYILFNSGIVGLLATKAAGGVTVRVTGATATDWAEVEVAGSDDYPNAFDGGWVQFVIDIDDLLASPDNTNGTPPTVGNIQRIGVTFITATTMPRMADNCWVDEIRVLPAATPALIIEGRDGGTTDWDWASVAAVAAVVDSAVLKPGPGGSFVCRGPIQFFIDDVSTHAFTDTNVTFLWDDQQFAGTDLYGFTQLGAATGTSNLTAGVKTGTGDDATGAQGWVVTAAATGVRWFLDVDAANIDSSNWYGCSFQHGADFQLDSSTVSVISSLFIDCNSARTDNAGDFLRCKIINANTADGVAFITTDDMTDIVFCEFEFSDGHAVELTTPRVATQTSKGNLFTGYGADASNDAALYNNSGGAVSLGITSDGDSPTVRNGASASTTIENFVTVQVSGITEGSAVKVIADETVGSITVGDVIVEGFANASGIVEQTQFNYEGAFDPSGLDVIIRARNQGIATACIANDGGAFTDETTEGSSQATNDMTLLPAVPVVNDAYQFGHQDQFARLKLDISTALAFSVQPTIQWQYWNGAWVALGGVTDGTSGLEVAGENIVSWTIPGDWATRTDNGQGPFFYVRAQITVLGTITTVPVGRKVTLDVTKYLPYNRNRIILPAGLSDVASWVVDSISQFAQ